MRLRHFLLSIFVCTPFFADAGVVINEIAWMGTVPKEGETAGIAANNEWMELFNSGSASVSIEGWKIIAEDGAPDILLLGSIPAQGYFLLERTDDNTILGVTADQIYTGSLGNSGEYLKLKDVSDTLIDEVNASGGWPAGDNTTKDTMQRSGSTWITASPTPGKANPAPVTTPPPPAAVNPPPSPFLVQANTTIGGGSPLSTALPFLSYGGENKKVAAGTLVDFLGYAMNAQNKPIDNVRFLWNFGDGETKEGRSITHSYRIPGKYTVGLHVSSGESVSSDYHVVEVVPNQISIGDVLEGEKGFVRFVNPSTVEIDLGGWLVDDGSGVRFVFPANTKLASQSEIALSNQISRLLLGTVVYPVTLRFPNGSEALQKLSPITTGLTIASTPIRTIVAEKPAHAEKIISQVASPPINQKIVAEDRETDRPAQGISSSSDSSLAAISSPPRGNSHLFFIAAVLVSVFVAGGFLIVKTFL